MRESLETLTLEYGKKDSVAELFGVLLYTDEHPNIKKVLRDEDYWMSFDEIMGEHFCVFSVRPAQGRCELPHFLPGTVGLMVPIWKEPRENKQLLDLFELKNTRDLPLLLLFAKVNGEYLTRGLPLMDGSVDDARNSIAENLRMSRSFLDKIRAENIKNPEGLYSAISLQLDDREKWRKLTNCVNFYKRIKELIP